MHYLEVLPSPPLLQYIDCYWVHSVGAEGDFKEQTCLPLGTVELIIQVNDYPSHHLIRNGVWEKSTRIFFAGFYEHAVTWKAAPGSVMFGIRLKPESLMHLFRFPVSVLVNIIGDAEALLGPEITSMGNEMYGVSDIAILSEIAEKHLTRLLSRNGATESRFTTACRVLRQYPKDMTINDLSGDLSVGKRQLERIFKDQLGVSPKTYQRILRFTHTYHAIQHQEELSWAGLTYDNGYSDQSHFIRDFKTFTGNVPTDFITKSQPYAPKKLSIHTY